MQEKKKCLFVMPNLLGGGAERVLVNLLRHLDDQRFECTLFLFESKGVYLKQLPKNIKIVSAGNGGRFILRMPWILFLLLIQTRKHDVVIAALELAPTYICFLASALTNTPLVAWVHISLGEYFKRIGRIHEVISRFIYPHIKHIILASESTKKSFEQWLGKKNNGKIMVIPYAIDSSVYEMHVKNHNNVTLSVNSREPTIIAVGRLCDQKGFDILIRAHQILLKKGCIQRLLILGEGPARPELEGLIAELRLQETVRLAGFVSNPVEFMRQSTVFVLSSRFEGFGVVLVEAMLAGIPIISTDCPDGPSDVLERGKYGVLVPVEDSNALANAIEAMLRSPEMQLQYQAKCRGRANHYNPSLVANKWHALLRYVTNESLSTAAIVDNSQCGD